MKSSERKAALLAVTENIEMQLFSSEESCVVISTQEEEEEYSFYQRHPEHRLVPNYEEPELHFQTQPRQQVKPKTEPPAKAETKHSPPVTGFVEEIQIEIEVFPPLRVYENEPFTIKSGDPSVTMTSVRQFKFYFVIS